MATTSFYLKVNRNSDYAIRNLQTWLSVCELYENSHCYVLCDNDALSQRISQECVGEGELFEIIASYRRPEDYSLIQHMANKRWLNAGLAHLTTFLHAAENQFSEFWNIDADDTRLCLSKERIKEALDVTNKYALDHHIDLFSLDMWRSRSEGYHWSFGIAYTNGNVAWIKEINDWLRDSYNSPYFSNSMHPKNIDEFFTYLKAMSTNVNIETFYLDNLLFAHFSDDLIFDPIQSGIYRWSHGKVEYPILLAIFGAKSFGRINIYEDVRKIDIGISAEEGEYQLAKYSNYSIETTNVLDAKEFRDFENKEVYVAACKKIKSVNAESNSNECILFGKGLYAKWLVRAIRDSGMKLCCIVDNGPKIQGHTFLGIKIVSPDEILKHSEASIFIGVKHFVAITDQLLAMGVSRERIYRLIELN